MIPGEMKVAAGDIEINKGDLVVVGGSQPFDLTFYPHAPKQVPDNFRIVAVSNALAYAGPREVVARHCSRMR